MQQKGTAPRRAASGRPGRALRPAAAARYNGQKQNGYKQNGHGDVQGSVHFGRPRSYDTVVYKAIHITYDGHTTGYRIERSWTSRWSRALRPPCPARRQTHARPTSSQGYRTDAGLGGPCDAGAWERPLGTPAQGPRRRRAAPFPFCAPRRAPVRLPFSVESAWRASFRVRA